VDNFYFWNPTKIVFGKDSIASLSKHIPSDAHILLIYGKGSIKRNGVYKKIKESLLGYKVCEFSGVEPNPDYDQIVSALQIIRKNSVSYLLAVGGGSVIDAAKFLALARYYEADEPWHFMLGKQSIPSKALPFGCVLTLPASGSEMNNCFVISRKRYIEKIACNHISAYPQFSILDPEVTYSLTNSQIMHGIVDSYVHVLEQYVTYCNNSPLQDRQAESILVTLIEAASKIIEDPDDYNVRASIMWCSTLAFNGIISRGVPQDWTTHNIGHELTALYGLQHAQTLAIILPGVWMDQFKEKADKLAQYGRRVLGLKGSKNAVALAAIKQTEDFFISLRVKTRFSEINLDAKRVAETVYERLVCKPPLNWGERKLVVASNVKTIIESRA
jgi:NADP-dependent alcohol dehydrogenase